MWQQRQIELLKDEIEAFLHHLADVPSLYDLVKEPLSKAGRGLATESAYSHLWCLLPLMVCEAVSGRYECALPVAAALQLLTTAGDVFDDIEDADSSDSLSARYGSAIATNVATTLLILAEGLITRLKRRGVKDYITVRVINAINSFYTTACAGQHLDLSLTLEIGVSEDLYIKVTGMKSASQVECACYIGALLAGAKQELIDTFSLFGRNLGMAAQITNDIQGVICGKDIMKRKITLPVIFAITQTDGEVRNQFDLIYSKQVGPLTDPVPIRDLLFRTGAIHYATVKVEFYKQQALDILSQAERAGANIERLKLFLK